MLDQRRRGRRVIVKLQVVYVGLASLPYIVGFPFGASAHALTLDTNTQIFLTTEAIRVANGGQGQNGQGQNGQGQNGQGQNGQGQNGQGQNGQGQNGQGQNGQGQNGQGQNGQGQNGQGQNGNNRNAHRGDPGNKGKKVGQLQATIEAGATSAVSQITGFIDRDLEGRAAARAASSGVATQYDFNSNLSLFSVSGASYTRHDGFTTTSIFGQSRSPSFEILNYGFTGGVRYDLSSALGLTQKSVTVGAFGNYTQSRVSFDDTNTAVALAGENGKASLTSGSAGAFGLLTAGKLYALGIASYSAGASDLAGTGASVSPGLSGFAGSGAIGTIVPLAFGVNADFRGQLAYAQSSTSDFVDENGLRINHAQVDELTGSFSVKFFTVERLKDWTIRPFLQAGAAQKLEFTNQVTVNSVLYNFNEDPTSFSGRIGVDLEQSEYLQTYIALRGDVSSDRSTVGGQIGLTLKLN